jgi:hypothetical protein
MPRADVPVTVDSRQAQQLAAHELSKSQYHLQPGLASPPVPTPSVSTSPPPPPPPTPSAAHGSTVLWLVLAIILFILVVVIVLKLRGVSGDREKKEKKDKRDKKDDKAAREKRPGRRAASEPVLFGAARRRRDDELAAEAGDWASAIRERFRALGETLAERGVLPERSDRTADETAENAGRLLPEHAETLVAAARKFDEVEYGEYLGSEAGYRLIASADSAVLTRGGADVQGTADSRNDDGADKVSGADSR